MKRRVMRVLERACYWLGVDAVFYWLNRGASRVIAFHNVLPDEVLEARDRGGICFSASAFRAVIRDLKRRFHVTADFKEPGGLVLTFDDGYLNQYETAARILDEEGGLPGVLFTSGALIGSRGFENSLVVDRILQWKIDVPMEIAEQLFGSSFASREQLWSEALLPLFAADVEGKGRNALARLYSAYSPVSAVADRNPEYVRQRFDGVTREQIADLRRRGWKVGYHTFSHFPVSRLSDAEAEAELRPVDPEMLKVPFAYPYGNPDFVSTRDEAVVARLGYRTAYSCVFDPSSRTGPFFLPRMMPPIDCYRLHFELCGLRHFLKYRKLLPSASQTPRV